MAMEAKVRSGEGEKRVQMVDYNELAEKLCSITEGKKKEKGDRQWEDFVVRSRQAFASTMASALEEVLGG